MNIQPFYVGQRVVALKTSLCGLIVKGKEYLVAGVDQCSCGDWYIQIEGYSAKGLDERFCTECEADLPMTPLRAANSKYFAPIIEQFQAITFEKVMEQELTSVN